MRQDLVTKIKEALLRDPLVSEVRRLSLFGSYLHGEEKKDSDIDLLIEFRPRSQVGFFKLIQLEENLGGALDRRVDLLTPQQLSPYFRDDVLREAKVIYEG